MFRRVGRSLAGWAAKRSGAARLSGWHKWHPGNSVLLRDGSWSKVGQGQNWRRKTADGWEYEQDEDYEGSDELRHIEWD